MVRIQSWESEVTGSNPIFCQVFEVVGLILIFYVFTENIFSPSCNKVARRPVETVPWSAVETVPWRVSLRQRAQFQKAAPEGTVS